MAPKCFLWWLISGRHPSISCTGPEPTIDINGIKNCTFATFSLEIAFTSRSVNWWNIICNKEIWHISMGRWRLGNGSSVLTIWAIGRFNLIFKDNKSHWNVTLATKHFFVTYFELQLFVTIMGRNDELSWTMSWDSYLLQGVL